MVHTYAVAITSPQRVLLKSLLSYQLVPTMTQNWFLICKSLYFGDLTYTFRVWGKHNTGSVKYFSPVHPFENLPLEFPATCDPYACPFHVDQDRQSWRVKEYHISIEKSVRNRATCVIIVLKKLINLNKCFTSQYSWHCCTLYSCTCIQNFEVAHNCKTRNTQNF